MGKLTSETENKWSKIPVSFGFSFGRRKWNISEIFEKVPENFGQISVKFGPFSGKMTDILDRDRQFSKI